MTAAFTGGGADPGYVSAAATISAAAKATGMTVTNDMIPGAGHGGDAVSGGLRVAIGTMYPVLGLSAP